MRLHRIGPLVIAVLLAAPAWAQDWVRSVDGENGFSVEHPSTLSIGQASLFGAPTLALVRDGDDEVTRAVFLVWIPTDGIGPDDMRARFDMFGRGGVISDASTGTMVDVMIDIDGGARAAYVFRHLGAWIAGGIAIFPAGEQAERRSELQRIVRSIEAIP